MFQNHSRCRRMRWNFPKCSKMRWNVRKLYKMLENDTECIGMLQNYAKCSRTQQDAPECTGQVSSMTCTRERAANGFRTNRERVRPSVCLSVCLPVCPSIKRPSARLSFRQPSVKHPPLSVRQLSVNRPSVRPSLPRKAEPSPG